MARNVEVFAFLAACALIAFAGYPAHAFVALMIAAAK